jgi:hypothetical protein
MNTNTSTILNDDQTKLFGLDEMSEEEQMAFLDEVGGLVFESATLRYLVELSEEEQEYFESYVTHNADDEDLLPKLEKEFPRFAEIFLEEVVAFKEEARVVLGQN